MRGLNPKILFSSREEQQDVLSKFGESWGSAAARGRAWSNLAAPPLCPAPGAGRAPFWTSVASQAAGARACSWRPSSVQAPRRLIAEQFRKERRRGARRGAVLSPTLCPRALGVRLLT